MISFHFGCKYEVKLNLSDGNTLIKPGTLSVDCTTDGTIRSTAPVTGKGSSIFSEKLLDPGFLIIFPVLHSMRCTDLQGDLGLEGERSIAF